jgi:hypothetical protein
LFIIYASQDWLLRGLDDLQGFQRRKDRKVKVKHNCLFVIYLSTRKQALRPGWQPFSKLPTNSKVYKKSRN